MKSVIILLLLILQLNANSLKIYVINILLNQKELGIILYNPKMEEQFGVFINPHSKNISYKFKELKDKQYFIIAFQDTNMNGYLDRNEKYVRKFKYLKNTNTKTIINMKKVNNVFIKK